MTASVTPINEPRSMLAYAKRYIARGWWVLPLIPGTKQPLSRLVPNGVHNASNDLATITRWWTAEPNAGIGVAVKPSGLVAIDIDPRNGGFETMERLEAQHGPLASDVLAYTGGGGEHRVFSSQLVDNLPGKLGQGVDVKADGYICVEPSIHPSGKAYAWEASSDPLEGCTPSNLPGWVRDLARGPFNAVPFIPATRLVDEKQVSDLREALATIPAEDYHQWVNFGNALCELGQAGFSLWDEWSQKSDKYDAQAATRKWRSFRSGAFQLESIFHAAMQGGWVNPASISPPVPDPVPVESVKVAPVKQAAPQPADLLRPPGILGEITDWVNATSRKPQPAFSVQAAIAFASTVLGRRFVTEHRNWPSLYLLNIGHSASGKEHAKWAVEALLDACELSHLIGPSSYTSSAGVLSSLHDQPSHITVIDEFGKEVEQASIKNNERAKGTQRTLIEVWGRCDGVVRPQGYSTFGLSQSDAAKLKERSIRNPALCLLAMTTPESFFGSIGSAAARDGFLNRFIIVESDIGPQVSQFRAFVPVPESVKGWAASMLQASEAAGPMVSAVAGSASLIPTPVEVKFSRSATELFTGFEKHCVDRAVALQSTGMMEMVGRCCEISMKLALIVALGCHKGGEFIIDGPHMAWAVNYVRFHSDRAIDSLANCVSDSDFAAASLQVLRCITKNGERGRTVPELGDRCNRFAAMPKRQQVELLESLRFLGKIESVTIKSTRGKPRNAWVAVAQEQDDDKPVEEGAN